MKIASGARCRRVKLFRPWIILGTIPMIGIFLLWAADTAHAQEIPSIGMIIESTTIVPRTGEVIVSGTITCSEQGAEFLNISVRQPIGREDSISGSITRTDLPCDEDGEPYTVSIFAFLGSFKPRFAVIDASFTVCPPTGGCFSSAPILESVTLQPQPPS